MEAGDLELVDRAVAGDERAFRALVERYQRRAYAVAFGILRDHDDALDVVQDAFVKVFKHLAGFKGDSAFYTWLYRIVYNLCIDRKRRSARAPQVDYDDTRAHTGDEVSGRTTLATLHIDGPGKAFARRELREQMSRALGKLSDPHREILLLREVEGLSYEELADTLDVPKGTVMSRLFHARKNFQAALSRYLEEGAQVTP